MLQYAITDRHFFPGDERQKRMALIRQATVLGPQQVDFVQIREKDLPAEDRLALALDLRAALPHGSRPRLLLNGDPAIAAVAGADGVHLPGGWSVADLSAARIAFQAAGLNAPILSLSAHTLYEVQTASLARVDLILFGPVFEKRVHGALIHPGVGLAALQEAAQAAHPTPVLALGGITPAAIPDCLAAGAAGVAAIRMYL